MAALLGISSLLANLGSLVCAILVLIKLFQAKGVLWGIFGVFCGIYAFIWGWINVSKNNNQLVMIAWSACIVVAILAGLGVGLTAPTLPQ
ncbi:MAG: hypothetical protein AAFY11_10730 [Cyanobacteria bacterium J06641_5]